MGHETTGVIFLVVKAIAWLGCLLGWWLVTTVKDDMTTGRMLVVEQMVLKENQTCCLQQDRERIKTWLLHGNFILFCQKGKRTCHLSEVWFRVGAVKEVPTETTFATPTESHEVEVNWFTRLGTTTWWCSRNHGSGATEPWEIMMTLSWKQCGRQIVPDGSQ